MEEQNISVNNIILQTEKIGKEFNGIWVLRNVDFDLRRGEIHSLVGENGAGKSTFIKIISGIHYPSAGKLQISGSYEQFQNVDDSEKAGIRTVHQEINLIPFFRVYQNMFLGDEVCRKGLGRGVVNDRKMRKKAREVLEMLSVDLDENIHTHRLDASMERVVQIGQVLVQEPHVLIFDEPTTSLGEDERKNLLKIIKQLKRTDVGIIYITHNLEEVMEISDRVTVLRDGDKIGTLEQNEISRTKIITMMVGHEELSEYEREYGSSTQSEDAMVVENLKNEKLDNISFSIKKGEILGIAGVVGAGKSELAKALFGIDKIESGEIRFKGKEYKPSLRKSLLEGIALVPEERKDQGIIENFSVMKNTTLAYLDDFCTAGYIKTKKEIETTKKYIEDLSIKASGYHQLTKYLSGGNQQKVILSRWLNGDFSLGIFDEPTKGIDIQAKSEIYELIDNLAKAGKAVLFLSSYLPELITMCDRILVLKNGKKVGEFSPDISDLQSKVMHAMLGGS
jgi:ABC-type sugar transport system ATPase subunit